MRRRELVRAALPGLVTGAAGCLGSLPGPLGGSGTSQAAFGTPGAAGDAALTLSKPRVRKAIAEDVGLWQEVRCQDGQYLLVAATTSGSVAARFEDLDLVSVVDGTVVEDVSLVVEGQPGAAPRNPPAWTGRALAFYFPDDALDRAALRWVRDGHTIEWMLGDALRERLAVEPRFELLEFDVARDGDDVRVHLAVQNAGDRAGDFLGQFSFEAVEDHSSVLPLSVPAGETAEFRGVPPILGGVAADGRVVTLAYTDGDGVSQLSREL